MARVSPARKAAFEILAAVERGRAHSDDLLRAKEVNELAAADRKLATALVLGVLRWQMRLDAKIRPLLKRPGAKLDAEILIALRMGAFQLLHLDRIPTHAAIDESVELAKRAGQRYAAGMVNAVLRRVARSGVEEENGEREDALAHPAWMVERWERWYGADAAQAICRHGQSEPQLTVRVPDESVEKELRAAGIELAPGELLNCARTVITGDVTATAAFREGRVRIQDEGSQLIGEMAAVCTAKDSGQEGKAIVDCCAAPGGKTLILAERNPRARVVACEASAPRLAALRKRVAAYGGRIECRLADAAALNEDAVFDAALVDAPCSGTGTLGRNPEIRHRLRVEDLARHTERQRAILQAALRAVRRSGHVVYATCSLEPEENEQVVAAVLAENREARQVWLEGRIEGLQKKGILNDGGVERLGECLTEEGALRLIPGKLGTDGFYVALMERTG